MSTSDPVFKNKPVDPPDPAMQIVHINKHDTKTGGWGTDADVMEIVLISKYFVSDLQTPSWFHHYLLFDVQFKQNITISLEKLSMLLKSP